MKLLITILAKSDKDGGYCVAGVDLGHNKLVRLIKNRVQGHDALNENDLADDHDNHCEVGDIVLADVDKVTEKNNHYWRYKNGDMLKIHPEDYFLNNIQEILAPVDKELYLERYIKRNKKELPEKIFGGTDKALSLEQANQNNCSLQIVKVANLKFKRCHSREKPNEYEHHYRAGFTYNNEKYDFLPVTDPIYKLELNDDKTEILTEHKVEGEAYLLMSLGSPFKKKDGTDYYCYKLIASVIPIKKRSLIHDSEADKRKLEEKNKLLGLD